MNGVHNSRNGNLEKPFPGCLGRMVNLFDLSAGMTGNRLLTDKPHRDGDFHILTLLFLPPGVCGIMIGDISYIVNLRFLCCTAQFSIITVNLVILQDNMDV